MHKNGTTASNAFPSLSRLLIELETETGQIRIQREISNFWAGLRLCQMHENDATAPNAFPSLSRLLIEVEAKT